MTSADVRLTKLYFEPGKELFLPKCYSPPVTSVVQQRSSKETNGVTMVETASMATVVERND